MSYISNSAFYLEVAKGNVEGHTAVNKFGRNPDIDSGSLPEDIWDGGGIWLAPTQARIHDIASTDAADTSAGTGVRTIRVFGLTDWDTPETTEDITLNGTTNVPTVNSYVIIHRLRSLTAGSGGTNAGTITATAQTDGTITAQMTPGFGQTLMAIYGWPSTQVFYITNWYGVWTRATGTAVEEATILASIKTEVDQPDSLFISGALQGLFGSGSTYVPKDFTPPVRIAGPAIVKLEVPAVSASNTSIAGGFDGVLVDNA